MKLIALLMLLSSCSLHYEFSIPSGDTEAERNADGNSSKK